MDKLSMAIIAMEAHVACSNNRLRQAWDIIHAKLVEENGSSHNNGSTPCRFFSRDKVCTGKAADGGDMYQSVPWCNHGPSQRAIP